jgi:hypothetical protein
VSHPPVDSGPTSAELGQKRIPALLAVMAWLLMVWVVAWTIVFSAIDFWSIKVLEVQDYRWFQPYRATMRYFASWVSPPSFALAENAYFIWMNVYDRQYKMHEWEWYSGNPVNPDGDFNFVWGDGKGKWVKFSMKEWYGLWLIPSTVWLGLVTLFLIRRGWQSRLQPVQSDSGWVNSLKD